ncbi:DEAD/DEAH box helicase [Pseudonocardia sp. ICBG601]|uniref:DEAD/DEAH box helicase n=1 Tax=Pseudonocardia sp. ICBG601 TaxID=2846759 RepID=UPI001CF70B1E|nr:DEAD/DEAH box helicase family protein [Pseudonocardia sp. ICBG601]
MPSWRQPQIGAVGALISHWSTRRHTPALISLPTGAGKTAVAVAARYLAQAGRTLVVVPTADLRDQLANAFASSADLVRIGALDSAPEVDVLKQVGLVDSWADIERFDVVVGLPNSISPVHYDDNGPRQDLFDLIIVDEAHHAPAPTWAAIIEHFESAAVMLLTATPRRYDGKALPGDHIFHYPLRRALDERIFQPVRAKLVGGGGREARRQNDLAIATEVVLTLAMPEHARSTLLVRAGSIARANELANLYRDRGVEVAVLNSRTKPEQKTEIVSRLRSGELKGAAVVGMLVEGFDLPSIRVIAYHDKHKSLPVTAQMIGRLARVDRNFPQESVLVTAKDVDVYPELQGAVRELYVEDPDWARILPGVIDDAIESEIANREFAERFTAGDPSVSLAALSPLRRIIVNELVWDSPEGALTELLIPPNLEQGRTLRSERVLYSGLSEDRRTLVWITEAVERPKWHPAPGLDGVSYNLHSISLAIPTRTDLPDLLLMNSDSIAMLRQVVELIVPERSRIPADAERMQQAFDSVDRVSVSSVGMRNSYGGQPGTAAYRMYSGKGVDRGLREVDTAAGTFGHAMVQVYDGTDSFTSGIASEKMKVLGDSLLPSAWVRRISGRLRFPLLAAVWKRHRATAAAAISRQAAARMARGARRCN